VPTHLAAPPTARTVRDPARTAPETPPDPFSPEIVHELELARLRGRKIRRAAGVASFTGWTVSICAAVTLLFGIFSITSLLLGGALAVVGYNEFSGAKMLRRLDLRAPRRLGFNQIGLCGVLIVYSLWSIHSTLAAPSPYAAVLASEGQAAGMLGSIEQLQTTVTLVVYGSLIIVSIVFQGSMAWYYFTRGRYIKTYISETRPCIVDLQRATSLL
jgi:hypothetical protein